MKRYLRLCLLLLISLALPFNGMAGIQSPSEPCPMQSAGMAKMLDMGHDCCDDMQDAADHGKPCKPGLECKTTSVLQVMVVKPATDLASPLAMTSLSEFLPEQAPSGVWRPPRA
ncbi:hypothetical protein ACM71K_30435 [Pseudomonas aeruginosa]